MLGGSVLHPIQFVKAAIFVCFLIALPLGGYAQAAAEDSKPAGSRERGWRGVYCSGTRSMNFEQAASTLLFALDPSSPLIIVSGRSTPRAEFITLDQAAFEDLSTSLNDARVTTQTIILLEDMVRKRYNRWDAAYIVLAEFHVVSPSKLGLESPWHRNSDLSVALRLLQSNGYQIDDELAWASVAQTMLESQTTLPIDFGEFDDRTIHLYGNSFMFGPERVSEICAAALQTYARCGDHMFARPFENVIPGNNLTADTRRNILYAIIHCPRPGETEGLYLAINGVKDALHQRWAIHGGIEKSPSHEFSLPVQDFITAGVQIPKLGWRSKLEWGPALNNDLKDLEDEVRENKRKFPRPSTAQGDDARDRILEQLAEIREHLEPHLKD